MVPVSTNQIQKSIDIWGTILGIVTLMAVMAVMVGIVTSYANPFVNIHLLNKAFLIMGMVTPIHSYHHIHSPSFQL